MLRNYGDKKPVFHDWRSRQESARSQCRPSFAASIPAIEGVPGARQPLPDASLATSFSLSCADNGIRRPTRWKAARRKVLIVDDDEETSLELIPTCWTRRGDSRSGRANNGFDAGMVVKEYRPDLIVLDIMLPDINGKEVCPAGPG